MNDTFGEIVQKSQIVLFSHSFYEKEMKKIKRRILKYNCKNPRAFSKYSKLYNYSNHRIEISYDYVNIQPTCRKWSKSALLKEQKEKELI